MYWYFVPLCIFWLLSWLLFWYGKTASFEFLNAFPAPSRQRLLYYLTELSSGTVLTSVFILTLCHSRPAETLLGVTCIFIAWYTCITINYNGFAGWKSPATAFGAAHIQLLNIHLQPELNFPSAQTTIIFALGTYLAWLNRPSTAKMLTVLWVNIFLSVLPVFAGWAFVEDIFAGSILGTLCCMLTTWWLRDRVRHWYERRNPWWQGIIIAIFRTSAICLLLVSLKYLTA